MTNMTWISESITTANFDRIINEFGDAHFYLTLTGRRATVLVVNGPETTAHDFREFEVFGVGDGWRDIVEQHLPTPQRGDWLFADMATPKLMDEAEARDRPSNQEVA